MSQIINFCARLEARLDQCLFANPDDDKASGVLKGVAVSAGGGVIGGGYLGHKAIMDKYSKRTFRGDRGLAETYKVAAANLNDTAAAAKRAGVKAGRKAYAGLRKEGVLKAGLGGIKKGVRAAISKIR